MRRRRRRRRKKVRDPGESDVRRGKGGEEERRRSAFGGMEGSTTRNVRVCVTHTRLARTEARHERTFAVARSRRERCPRRIAKCDTCDQIETKAHLGHGGASRGGTLADSKSRHGGDDAKNGNGGGHGVLCVCDADVRYRVGGVRRDGWVRWRQL